MQKIEGDPKKLKKQPKMIDGFEIIDEFSEISPTTALNINLSKAQAAQKSPWGTL